MTADRERAADLPAIPREERLASSLRRLLDTTELNMDDMEEETREAIREAFSVLDTTPPHGS